MASIKEVEQELKTLNIDDDTPVSVDDGDGDDEESVDSSVATDASASSSTSSTSSRVGKKLGIHFEPSSVRRIIKSFEGTQGLRLSKKGIMGVAVVVDYVIRQIVISAVSSRNQKKKRLSRDDIVRGIYDCNYDVILNSRFLTPAFDFPKSTVNDMLSQFYMTGQIGTRAREYIITCINDIATTTVLSTSNFYYNRGKPTLALEDCVRGVMNFLDFSTNLFDQKTLSLFEGFLVDSEGEEELDFCNLISEIYVDKKFGEGKLRRRKTPIPLSSIREFIRDIIPTNRVTQKAKEFMEWVYIFILSKIMKACSRAVDDGKTITYEIAFITISSLFKYQVFLL
jgi:histone H3/H4